MTTAGSRAGRSRHGTFLYGYYGAGNLGDDLLLFAAIRILRDVFAGGTIFVRDHGDLRGLSTAGDDVIFTGIEALLADSGRGKLVRFTRYLFAYAKVLRRCDWLVFGGGTLFHEAGTVRPLLLQWLICLIARINGARIASLGVGVGDLKTPAARWLLRRIVRLQDLFLVRDDAAVAQGAAAGVVVRRAGDLVFSDAPSFAVRDANPRTIALTVVPPAFPTGEARAQAATELAAAVRIWRAQGRRVAFLVFQRSGVTPGDRVLFDLVAEHLGEPIGEVRILDPSRTSIEAAFADVAAVCGMRFHALVLAALVGVPFVGLAHDNKIEDICRRFGMPALSAFSFRCEDLVSAVERVAGRPPQPDLVARCIAEAAENSLLLKSVAS